MKLSVKIGKTSFFAMLIIFGAVLTLDLDGNSRDNPLNQNLMDSMKISRMGEETKAPDFILADLQGKNFRLSDLQGKVVLVNFWTTW